MIDGLSYQVVPQTELLRVSNDIRSTLGLSKSTKLQNAQTQTDNSTGDTGDQQASTYNGY